MLSPHPVGRRIRELIATRRAATATEIAAIIARMASALFDGRDVAVLPEHQRLKYAGRELGLRASSLVYHLVRRIPDDRQWVAGTTTEEYLADLRSAILVTSARLALYSRRGGTIAATLTATALALPQTRVGESSLTELLVVSSADRATLITGYQCSSLATAGIPPEALWLK